MSSMDAMVERRKRVVWLTSFGDLLTLLLCFFMTLASFANINAQKKAKESQGVINTTATKSPPGDISSSGTQLAVTQTGTESAAKKPAELPFRLTLKAGELTAEGLGNRLSAVAAAKPQILSLEVCSDELRADEPALRTLLTQVSAGGTTARLSLTGCEGADPETAARLLFE